MGKIVIIYASTRARAEARRCEPRDAGGISEGARERNKLEKKVKKVLDKPKEK